MMSILGYKQAPGAKVWQTIPELSIEAVIKSADPEGNGFIDGADNKPPTESTIHAETEHRIAFEAESHLKIVDDQATKEFTDISRTAGGLSVTEVNDDFHDLEMRVKTAFNRHAVNALAELKHLRVEERRELRDLRLFRAKNRLDRLAKYPESPVLHIALVGLFLLLESAANMFYFSEASDWALLGGLVQALGISVANIAVSFATGLLALRYMHHINFFKAFCGVCCVGVWLGVIITAHFLVAHYRDLLLIDPEHALLKTWDKFRADAFHFESMDSVFVLLIGLVISITALVKGYTFDDFYPAYGKKDRDYNKKATNLHKAEAELRAALLTEISSAEADLKQRLNSYEERQQKLVDLFEGASAVVNHFDNIYMQVDDIVRSAVNTYREANLKVRTAPAPHSFNGMPMVNRLLNKERFTTRLEELRRIKDSSAKKLAELRRHASNVLEEFTRKTEEMNSTLDSLADEVHRRADAKITEDEKEG